MNPSAMDLVFIILLGLLTLRGFLKGFTGEFFSIASLALGLISSVFFFKNGANFLRVRYFQNLALLPEILAFFGIFLVVFIAGKILEHIIKDIIGRLNLDKLDKVLGLVIGLAEAVALIFLVLFLLRIQPLFDGSSFLEGSIFARVFLSLIGGFGV
jgi:membrane protein required for colicin V production